MKKGLLFTCYLCLFLGSNFYVSCKSNKLNPDTTAYITQKLETDKSQYLLGETIIVKNYLKNNSKEELVICKAPTTQEMFFTFYDGIKPLLKKDTAIFDNPTSKVSFVRLSPNSQTDFGSIEFGEEYFDKAGIWNLYIISRYNFTGEDFGFNAWQGIVSSNILTVHIKDSEKSKEGK